MLLAGFGHNPLELPPPTPHPIQRAPPPRVPLRRDTYKIVDAQTSLPHLHGVGDWWGEELPSPTSLRIYPARGLLGSGE